MTEAEVRIALEVSAAAVMNGLKHMVAATYHKKYAGLPGFGSDGGFLTSLNAYRAEFGTLTDKQMYWAHKMMPKYAGQVLEVMKRRVAEAA